MTTNFATQWCGGDVLAVVVGAMVLWWLRTVVGVMVMIVVKIGDGCDGDDGG